MNIYDCRILLVDDEPALLDMVENMLKRAGFIHIDRAQNACMADFLYRSQDYQLVLLDVMLPDQDGFFLFASWTALDKNIPVIFLSARDEDRARLKGLGLGADDYITKPFLPEELILRVKAVLRRAWRVCDRGKARIGNVEVDFESGLIRKDGKEAELTAKEFMLLQKLCENRGNIVSVNSLMDTLWPDGSFGFENSLMVHVRRLREKIEENPSKPEYLQTVRGLGYRLRK